MKISISPPAFPDMVIWFYTCHDSGVIILNLAPSAIRAGTSRKVGAFEGVGVIWEYMQSLLMKSDGPSTTDMCLDRECESRSLTVDQPKHI